MFDDNWCKQWRQIKLKGATTKWPVRNQKHRTAQNTHESKRQQTFRNNSLCVFFGILIFLISYLYFIKRLLQEMSSYRLGTVLSHRKPHTFSTFIGKKTKTCALTCSPMPLTKLIGKWKVVWTEREENEKKGFGLWKSLVSDLEKW